MIRMRGSGLVDALPNAWKSRCLMPSEYRVSLIGPLFFHPQMPPACTWVRIRVRVRVRVRVRIRGRGRGRGRVRVRVRVRVSAARMHEQVAPAAAHVYANRRAPPQLLRPWQDGAARPHLG